MEQAAKPPLVKVGKVVSIHREDSSVDVVFEDGGLLRHVPVASGCRSTTFGLSFLAAPTFDKDVLARKTYPEPAGSVAQPPWNPSEKGRDQYVIVLQAEGSGLGAAGAVIVGYFAPQVSEMEFAKDDPTQPAGNNLFSDLFLFRHPSDFQTTVDYTGKISLQHPNKTRITMGEDTGRVDLTERDYDRLYRLRHNLERKVDILLTVHGDAGDDTSLLSLTAGGSATLFAASQVTIKTNTATIRLDPDGNVLIDASGEVRVTGTTIKLN